MAGHETESEKFDACVRKILSVSHDVLVKREKERHHKRQFAHQHFNAHAWNANECGDGNVSPSHEYADARAPGSRATVALDLP